jgi:carbonic anhydrase
MPDELLARLRRFHDHTFPGVQDQFQDLVRDGQHPTILFIGCSDSRLVPYLLTGTGPGELFIVRNVGAFVPPYESQRRSGPAGRLSRHIGRHRICGAQPEGGAHHRVRAQPLRRHPRAVRRRRRRCAQPAAWLDLGREAVLPVQLTPEALRRTEQRAVVLQLERLMDYPMVRRQVDANQIALHGWHYVIEEGEVHVFDVHCGAFVPASSASHSGTGPYLQAGGGLNPVDAW